jgi:hypothetical protein
MLLTLVTGWTIWKNYQRVSKKFAFDASETVDFSDIMHGPVSIPRSLRRNGTSNRHPSRKDYRKSNSVPYDIEDGTDDSDGWNQQSENLIQRRQKSPHKSKPSIQLI